MDKYNNTHSNQLAAACILLSVANADEILEDTEIEIIKQILIDFFSLDINYTNKLLNEAENTLKNATDLFQFGTQLNSSLNQDDKLEFIRCIFEVAYADNDLHYLEHHTIKKIANILNLHRNDIISAKSEIESYL